MSRVLVEDLPAELDSIGRQLASSDLAPAWQDCHDVAAEDIAWHFSQRRGPDGAMWQPRKDNKPHPLLILSGAMFAAATGGTAHIFEVAARHMDYGVSSSIVYAGAQNFGSDKRNIPQREFLGLSSSAVDKCAEIIASAQFQIIA